MINVEVMLLVRFSYYKGTVSQDLNLCLLERYAPSRVFTFFRFFFNLML
jgi:hypothetical protein